MKNNLLIAELLVRRSKTVEIQVFVGGVRLSNSVESILPSRFVLDKFTQMMLRKRTRRIRRINTRFVMFQDQEKLGNLVKPILNAGLVSVNTILEPNRPLGVQGLRCNDRVRLP